MADGKPQQIYVAIIEHSVRPGEILVASFTTQELRESFLQRFLIDWWKKFIPPARQIVPSYERLKEGYSLLGYGYVREIDMPLITAEPDIDLLFEEK